MSYIDHIKTVTGFELRQNLTTPAFQFCSSLPAVSLNLVAASLPLLVWPMKVTWVASHGRIFAACGDFV